jgi:citrate synthase
MLTLCAGIHKSMYWDPIYEDSLDLIAKLPGIAATIYRNVYKNGKLLPAHRDLDWAGNLACMMGIERSDKAALDMMRMYQTIHTGVYPNCFCVSVRLP